MSETRQPTALITGASSGIGFQVSKQLSQKGYKVYAGARRLEPMEPLKKYGVIPIKLDVSSIDSVLDVKKFLIEELKDGKLDILYNNAGQSCTFPGIDVTDAQVEQVFQVNVFGGIRLTRELISLIIKAHGTILFTGSLAGIAPFPFGSVYSATKAAIHQYARALHLELKPFDVRVINVITGGVLTDIADKRALPQTSLYNIPEGQHTFSERQEMAKRNQPMSAEKYSSQVINDIISGRDTIDVYRGSKVFLVSWLIRWFPGWAVELIFQHKFKLNALFKALRRKYSDGVDLHLD
ncbi:3-oxoacyl-[acyl-carrier-protein] reductase [Wickerhamomyces ciferrii]|uniref:3-oxoacyl-[acyl-carrier-protein] reductase n=1 Tax=Wickerhamomyces ciferrii (strain ATCC 14091 / BCRC 22168 / CBS 111 / JCM 3599 / NBRC 0793 / NRRL Y-1031 F-60-10) TaxID=1206466 RepID=K0KAN2_WICCF|nr:3-oxoacyl-[acyl-carrier-protein] reductase [Wickerhamomyces ciferrii]CCH42045.1 3-oxoacyl-[acyl-carrier-protein] reductase [Wickerhamomyces ciferrii]